jgi:phage baseplate assembly protein V
MSFVNKMVHRIEMLVAKALIDKIDDSGQLQLVKISGLAGEVQEGIERVQNYGMTSVPPNGGEAVVVYLNGNRDHGVAVAVDSAVDRPKDLRDGEVELYSKHGHYLFFKNDGVAHLMGDADFAVAFNDLKAGFDQLKNDLNTFITTTFNAHVHPGVMAGPASTGPTPTPGIATAASIDAAKVDEVKLP